MKLFQYTCIIGAYLGLLFSFLSLGDTFYLGRKFSVLDYTLLALGTFRISKLLSEDEVTRPIREGTPGPVRTLIHCQNCTSVWVASFLVYAFYIFPSTTRVLLSIMSLAAVSQILNALLDLTYKTRDNLI